MTEHYYNKTDITNFATMLTTLALAMLAYYSLFSYHGVI
ncbi:MAG: hypothetical protein AWU59_2662 [Methanolobus sp. T82-4]|nr:MAG: hypothetical protein AWU59_2662 [Methanolobus sp. T82-4]